MTLSGYLFAKLLNGKKIRCVHFFWNRFLRLTPLLTVVILLAAYQEYLVGGDLVHYSKRIVSGAIKPSLPNGGWSITIELHFYALLPLLLFLSQRWKHSLLWLLLVAVLIRSLLYQELGQIQKLSYFTILGRIDQFLLGILAYRWKGTIAGRHLLTSAVLSVFAIFYWHFDSRGGFYSYPSSSAIWTYLPTLEGAAYAWTIAWYDNSFQHSTGTVSRFIARIGTYSYSIYLLHFFIVFRISNVIHNHVMNLSNIYLILAWSVPCFLMMTPIGYLSYRFIESPFLRFRTDYTSSEPSPPHAGGTARPKG
jgi:peptidoglycan/LPS O-acetylase OafA/YrhL